MPVLEAREHEQQVEATANYLDMWKWIAGTLFAVILAGSAWAYGAMSARGISEERAVQLVQSVANPYVANQGERNLRVSQIEQKLATVEAMNAKINRICIALGIDPETGHRIRGVQ